MNYSVKQLALLMVVLMVVVTLISSTVGLYLLEDHYQTEENRFEADAHNRLELAAGSIANQIKFYQGIVNLIVARRSTADLIAFGAPEDTQDWALHIRNLLPGAFGAALATLDGEVIGDPITQRIGESCQADLQHFSRHEPMSYPPLHTRVEGLEHFDLMAHVEGDRPEDNGVLLISFHINNLQQLLDKLVTSGDKLLLKSPGGKLLASAGSTDKGNKPLGFSTRVPNSNWEVQLYVARPPQYNIMRQLALFNIGTLAVVVLIITFATQRFSHLIHRDLHAIHATLSEVINGTFEAGKRIPELKEFAAITPDINRLAETLQMQNQSLREQSLSDALTGLNNRRYFDIMIQHVFEHSRRHTPAVLLIIDLNDFKTVNDQLGHPVGDQALKDLAKCLGQSTRASDEVARLGGDEFAVILQDIETKDIENWIQQLCDSYDRNVLSNKSSCLSENACTLSVGVSLIDANYYRAVGDVLHAADMAMYEAKSNKIGQSRFVLAASILTNGGNSKRPHK